ncbi:NUDIX domain-containing protein [Candidatus Micrarchaeota archaeon]|nr:NUDIX domain-containing protein [Candidatus Micrarchaeota archaeon]
MVKKDKVKKEVSAGCILFFGNGKQRKYLLLHYESGHWDFIKGHVEKGETLLETALRELNEETGIKRDQIEIIPGFKERINFMFRDKWSKGRARKEGVEKKEREPLVSKDVYFFLFRSKTMRVKLSYEHIGYLWLKCDDAVKKATYKTAKELLRKADDFLKQEKLV